MQDLSHLAEGSMTATSQGAGNMMSGRPKAMSAPGSQPVDPLPPAKDQGTPDLEVPVTPMKTGTDGKPQPSATGYHPGPPSWKPTTTPEVVRES